MLLTKRSNRHQKKSLLRHQTTLLRFANKHRQRTLSCPHGIDFSSNDYLAFSHSFRIKNAIRSAIDNGMGVGSGGSRLLRGNHDAFEKLEWMAAHFFGSEKALYFISGYTANLAIFATLPQRGDLILFDERVHASMLDGVKASRAQARMVRHNDIENTEKLIQEWRKKGGMGRPWIAVESLYSMEGDRSSLSELFTLANHHDGFLVIDDAHATGVFGPHGRGLASFLEGEENVIVLHTCGKALGVSGALICLNTIFYHYLINHARVFIYSTAPSPLMAAGVSEALNILSEEPQHRSRIEHLYHFANNQFERGSDRKGSGSQILPVFIGDNHFAVRVANRMQASGYDVRAIRPPTVSEKTARLRISITLHVNEEEIERMFTLLFTLLEEETQWH
jgi:8-amino-7-oxononanoate synthase